MEPQIGEAFGEAMFADWFDYWFMSREQLESLASESGWQVVAHQPLSSGSYLAVLEETTD